MITGFESNEQILCELGERIRDTRIRHPMTQKELADRSGLSLKTVSNIEKGKDTNLGSLIAVLRTLGLLANIDMMLPEQEMRPSDYLKEEKKRLRAYTAARRGLASGDVSWVWGEDA